MKNRKTHFGLTVFYRRLSLLSMLLVCCVGMGAQRIVSKPLPFFHQLLSNEIFDIYQDKEGYMWIGTTNGLVRYDGYQLQSFRSDYKNMGLLTDNTISIIVDNSRYVWIGTRKGLNLYDKETCQLKPFPELNLHASNINHMAVDKEDHVWIAVDDKLYKCRPDATLEKVYELFPGAQRSYLINYVYVDRYGSVWVLTGGGGLFQYDPEVDTFKTYPVLGRGNAPYTMYQDQQGNYWIGTWSEGLWRFFPDETEPCYKRQYVANTKNGSNETNVYSIIQDDKLGYLWMLSYDELYALKYTDKDTLEAVDIRKSVDTHMMYTKICKDREGNLWLGSYDMAYIIYFDDSRIENYPLPQLKKDMGWDSNILNLCLDENLVMWLIQDRYGLCLYDMVNNCFIDNELHRIGEADLLVKSAYQEGFWITLRNKSIVLRVSHSNPSVPIKETIRLPEQNPGTIKSLTEDGQGNLWILAENALFVKQRGRTEVVSMKKGEPSMAVLTSDLNGRIWGVSVDNRLYQLCYVNNGIQSNFGSSIPSLSEREIVSHMCVDARGCLWLISSLGRMLRSDEEKRTYRSAWADGELENNLVLGVLADKDKVWVVTNKKILQWDIYKLMKVDYMTTDGNIGVDVFRYKAFSLDGQGGIYVGGHQGFVHIRSGNEAPAIVHKFPFQITNVKVENRSVFFDNIPSIHTIDQIILKPEDRNLEIFFSPLQYPLNPKIRLAYKLDGMDKDWIYLDYGKNSAFYNQLKKGTYQFRLKMEYGQGQWSDDEVVLTIIRKPAPYETGWAYLVYIVCIGLVVYGVSLLYLRRIRRMNQTRLKEEMARTKLDYFTNVSHELLTPLTVIACSVDNIKRDVPTAYAQCDILKANVERLKRLIRQILDFKKADAGQMRLHVQKGEIGWFIQKTCRDNFSLLAEKKHIELCIRTESMDKDGYIDFDLLDKMLYNLLSNALKYTPEYKRVCIEAETIHKEGMRWIVLKVADEGIGIEAGEIEKIFTRFYTGKHNRGVESNGIGLSLTRSMAELCHGHITVESCVGKGTCFTLELPIDREAFALNELESESMDSVLIMVDDPETTVTVEQGDRPVLLLIDDNVELLKVMKEALRDRYSVLTASTGKMALELLNEHEVDVIVCDVMLPDTNGWELCKHFKADLRFCHIPVIILTACHGINDRVAGYDAGADAYLTKPFEIKLLKARISNLIRISHMRRAAFQGEENINLETLAYPSADKQFLDRVIKSIEVHLEQPEFDLPALAHEIGLSKSTLYRKIKSMTGLAARDFVRNVKMKKACVMLVEHNLTIAEIAYATGFTDPKYFTRCFKDEFGVTPTDYQKQHASLKDVKRE